MSLRKILFIRYGENISTDLDPLKEYNESTDKSLLSVVEGYCQSYDDNRLVTGNKYDLREIDIPGWLTTEDFIRNNYRWKFILSYPEIHEKLGSSTYKIFNLDYTQIKGLSELFKVKTFKSKFRKSLYDQVISWINDPSPKYRSPLSDNQWSSILRFIK